MPKTDDRQTDAGSLAVTDTDTIFFPAGGSIARGSALPDVVDWSDPSWFWTRFEEMFEQRDEAATFEVLRTPLRVDTVRPLGIVVHPGDAGAETGDRRRNYLLEKQVLMCCELHQMLRCGHDLAILHRASSGYAFDDKEIDSDYRVAIEAAHQAGACLLYGDDLRATVAWMTAHLAPAERPAVLVTGVWADASHGCAAAVADGLYGLGANVRLSDAAPVTSPRRHRLDRWRSPATPTPTMVPGA